MRRNRRVENSAAKTRVMGGFYVFIIHASLF